MADWNDPTVTSLSTLSSARYGKDLVRMLRVVRGADGKHEVAEYSVQVLLEGDIETSYTQADNSVVVATDSQKNIVYCAPLHSIYTAPILIMVIDLAKTSPHVLSPTHFALHVGAYLKKRYSHIHKVYIKIEGLRWSHIPVEGSPHPHSFVRDGDEKVLVDVEVRRFNPCIELLLTSSRSQMVKRLLKQGSRISLSSSPPVLASPTLFGMRTLP